MPGGENIKPGADKAHMDTDTVHFWSIETL